MKVKMAHMKGKLKRVIAGGLSVLLMATSVPMTSLADTPGFGSNAGGDGSSTVGGSGSGTKFRAIQQGLRFTIVDQDLHAVSNSVDFVLKHPKYSQYGNMLNTSYKFMNGKGDNLTRFVEGAGVYYREGTSGQSPTDKLKILDANVLKNYLNDKLDELGDIKTADGSPVNGSIDTEIKGFASDDGTEYYGEDIKMFLMRGDIFAEGEVSGGSGESGGGSMSGGTPPSQSSGGSSSGGSSGSSGKPSKPSSGGSSKPSGGESSSNKLDLNYMVGKCDSAYASHRNSSIKAGKTYAQYISGLGDLQSSYLRMVDNTSIATASHKLEVKKKISGLWPAYNDRVSYESAVETKKKQNSTSKGSTSTSTPKKPTTTINACVNYFKAKKKGSFTSADVNAKCNAMGLGNADRQEVKSRLQAAGYDIASNISKNEQKTSLFASLFGPMTVYAATTGGPGGGTGNDSNNQMSSTNTDTKEPGDTMPDLDKDGNAVNDGWDTIDEKELLYAEDGTVFNGWLPYIVNYQFDTLLGGGYLFEIEGMTAESNVLEMVEHDYLVLVEPLIFSNYKGTSWSSGETIYGTFSNIVDILGQEGRPNYIVQSWGPNYAYNALKLNHNYETSDGKTYVKSERSGFVSITDLYKGYRQGGDTIQGDMMQLYSTASYMTPSSGINTWDKEKYPEKDGPSPDPSEKPEESSYGDDSKSFKIVKYYEQDDGSGYIPWSYYGVPDNPHKVIVQDEKYFKCIEYFTSTKEDSYPPNGEDASKYTYADQKTKYNDGKYKGNGTGTVTVKPADQEKVLHVLLRYQAPQTSRVVKVYESDGVTDKVKAEDIEIEGGKYPVVTPDSGYNYTESTQIPKYNTTDPNSWADVPQDNHSVEKIIPIPETTKTIYIHYVQGGTTATPIILYENEISHNFSTAQLVENKVAINWQFPDKYSSGGSHHHRYDDDGDCNGWTCSWHTELSDSSYTLEVANTYNYNSTSFIGGGGVFIGSEAGKVTTSSSEKSSNISGFTTEDIVPEWKFVGYRDKNTDKVTLYPNKNGADIKNEISLLGIVSEGSKPAGTRIDTKDGGSWYNTFQTGYNYTGNNDKYLSSKGTGCSSHAPDDSQYSGTESATADDLNTAYSSENNMKTYYYLGEPNSGLSTIDTTNNAVKMLGKTFNKYMSSNTKNENHVMFYPYIKMKYQTFGSGDRDVYVTSENLSDILIANRVEVGFYKEGSGPNLQLDSTQWSTHSRALAGLSDNGVSDKNSILPGGAALTLKAGQNGTKTIIGVRTYQTVVPDGLKVYLADGSQILTQSEAEAQYNTFIADAKDVLEHYQVVQWVTKGISKNISEFEDDSNKKLVSGSGAVTSYEGQQLAKDSKYYLKPDGTGADRADIDILTENSIKTVWTIKSNTDGVVTVEKNGSAVASINANQGVGLLLQNEEIKLLNDKTKLIENYISAIDRNKGRNRDNQKWYNEAFDGLSVICNEWEAELGFSVAEPVRSSIIDTKLCGVQSDRRDAYNFDTETVEDKVRTSIFMTSAKSTSGKATGKPDGYLGTLGDMQIRINGIEEMFSSKPFYIPNATVTDLN